MILILDFNFNLFTQQSYDHPDKKVFLKTFQ